MRVIKLRAWDKRHHKMHQTHHLLLDTSSGHLYWQAGTDVPTFVEQENYILMQFTGLLSRHDGMQAYQRRKRR